ncbi:MAG: SDR family NAD(P)-dependent oxidoreductase [Nostoc sp.]|uniref:type I polyketide synthase n=1 Tax=Nostoc sp. TaxID=1180 RepID=UPI002FFCFFB9
MNQPLSSQQLFELLEQVHNKLEAVDREKTEAIAIIGMGCRFPGNANNPASLWRLLQDGVDAVGEVPSDRWDVDAFYDPDSEAPSKSYTRNGSFIQEVDQFDPEFFGMSPREAASLDPQQRLLLEVTWEALENAGLAPNKLRNSRTGVYVGICTDDHVFNQTVNAVIKLVTPSSKNQETSTSVDGYTGIGVARSIAVGRISHLLGLQGPNIQLDTACSSSLVAVHLACQSLRLKECNLALVGGVNAILFPGNTIARCKMKALAPDGRCKTFAASADGYGQGEGCGMVVLKRLSDALADGDSVLAVIRGSATNHDGPSGGLTVPNKKAQKEVIQQALQNARVEPHQVSYVEAHGTGTTLGDPIELESLAAVYGKNRPHSEPLVVGSVKTNFGHLEAAAGVSSLMKVVLALYHQEIPPHLHFTEPNPYIPWNEIPVVVPTTGIPWLRGEQPRMAGVSSFGMSGSNAHVILEEAPEQVKSPKSKVGSENSLERPVHLLTLSAKTPKALEDLASSYYNHLKIHPEQRLEDICYTANTGRSHFQYRLAVLAASEAELREKLGDFSTNNEALGLFSGQLQNTSSQPKIAFLFTGQGSQYIRMGWELYQTQPIFRQALEQCDRILQPYLKIPLLEVLYSHTEVEDQASHLVNETVYTQPALFALEYALVQLWKSWGIEPDVVMGHSVGEYVAATVAGVFSLEDGLKLIATRGRLMQQLPEGGEMVSVLASESQVREALAQPTVGIAPYTSQVAIAAFNGPENIVISGVSEAIGAICSSLESQGVKIKRLQVSHAFHSPLMEPMLREFEAVSQQVSYNQPRIPLISNVTGQRVDKSIATHQYWVDHVRQPVRFAQSIETLHQQGYRVFLEIGPKPILLGMGRQCLPDNQKVWLASLRSPQSDSEQMLSSLGQLYVQGAKVDWLGFDRDYPRGKVMLPTYPFQRQLYPREPIKDLRNLTFVATENGNTSIVNLLSQGYTTELAQKLEKAGNFSPEQVKLLPDLLAVLSEKHQQELATATIKDWLYQVQWKPFNISQEKPNFQLSHWLIFADLEGLGRDMMTQLQHQGHECSLVYRADTYHSPERGIYQINPEHPQEFEQLYQAIIETSTLPVQRVIHLWSLDASCEQDLTTSALESAQLWGCGSVLHLLQALVKNPKTTLPQLWLVTRGSQPVFASKTEQLAVTQSSLWGLGQVISFEHPQLWGGLVDLDPQGSEDEGQRLLQLLADNRKEDHLAVRDRNTYIARLVKQSLPEFVPLSLRSDATYLITGGLGALGLHTAEWMVSKGAKHLVLISRRQPAEQAQKTIERLEQAGASIHVLCADISSEQDVVKILEQVQTSLPPLLGVIHADGVLDDGMIQQMSWERFAQVMAPKVKGAWYLHKLTQQRSLDFFVCFSSMASLLGSPSQENYAAANAFMHPAIRETVVIARENSAGDKQLVAYLVPHQEAAPTVSDLRRFLKQQLPEYMVPSAFVTMESLPLTPNGKVDRRALPALDSSVREQEDNFVLPTTPTEAKLAVIWAEVLGVQQVGINDNFFELGGHSLLSTQIISRIRQAFSIEVPLSLLFEEPTIASLGKEIETALYTASSGASRGSAISNILPPFVPATREGHIPLSLAQEYMWYEEQLNPGSCAGNSGVALRFTVKLSSEVLERSINEIIRRHEILRTTFPVVEGQPVQVVALELTLPLKIINLQDLPPGEREAKALNISELQISHHFDLANGPLIKTTLLQLSSEEHWLLIPMHHIITDGWSIGIFLQELETLYNAFSNGLPSPLREVPFQYADFTLWQRQQFNEKVLEKQLCYWLQKLTAPLQTQEYLPAKEPNPNPNSRRASSYSLILRENLVASLENRSHSQNVTTSTILIAALKLLLFKWNGQSEILILATIGNRSTPEIEKMLGCFINDVILRTQFDDEQTGVALLEQVKETLNEAIDNKEIPLQQVMEAVKRKREITLSASVTIVPLIRGSDLMPLWDFAPVPSKNELWDKEIPLELYISAPSEELKTLEISAVYSTDLFTRETIERLFSYYQEILQKLAESPEIKIAAFERFQEKNREAVE